MVAFCCVPFLPLSSPSSTEMPNEVVVQVSFEGDEEQVKALLASVKPAAAGGGVPMFANHYGRTISTSQIDFTLILPLTAAGAGPGGGRRRGQGVV